MFLRLSLIFRQLVDATAAERAQQHTTIEKPEVACRAIRVLAVFGRTDINLPAGYNTVLCSTQAASYHCFGAVFVPNILVYLSLEPTLLT